MTALLNNLSFKLEENRRVISIYLAAASKRIINATQ
jgi:ribosomal protein S17E